MSNNSLYLVGANKLANGIAAKALQDALKRTTLPMDTIVEDSFMSRERIQTIANGTANKITFLELVQIGLALNMVVKLDFEDLN